MNKFASLYNYVTCVELALEWIWVSLKKEGDVTCVELALEWIWYSPVICVELWC